MESLPTPWAEPSSQASGASAASLTPGANGGTVVRFAGRRQQHNRSPHAQRWTSIRMNECAGLVLERPLTSAVCTQVISARSRNEVFNRSESILGQMVIGGFISKWRRGVRTMASTSQRSQVIPGGTRDKWLLSTPVAGGFTGAYIGMYAAVMRIQYQRRRLRLVQYLGHERVGQALQLRRVPPFHRVLVDWPESRPYRRSLRDFHSPSAPATRRDLRMPGKHVFRPG